MTKIDGHRFHDQKIGRWQSGMSTADLTWRVLRGRSVTKPKGRGSKSAQSIYVVHAGQAQYFRPFSFIGLGLLF
jgi:hypothetical protein